MSDNKRDSHGEPIKWDAVIGYPTLNWLPHAETFTYRGRKGEIATPCRTAASR